MPAPMILATPQLDVFIPQPTARMKANVTSTDVIPQADAPRLLLIAMTQMPAQLILVTIPSVV